MPEKKIENSGCLWCGSETEEDVRNGKLGKLKKYCNNKCANKYYTKEGRYRPKDADGNLLNPDWGSRAKKEKERKQKQIEKYEWYKANWYTTERIEQEFGTPRPVSHGRANTAGIKSTKVSTGKAPNTISAFWSPEDAKRIATIHEQITPIPKGYLTNYEAASYLGYSKASWIAMFHKSGGCLARHIGRPTGIKWQDTHGKKCHRVLYTKKVLDEWKTKIEKLRQEKTAETKRRQEEKRRQREQLILQKQNEFEKATKNLLTSAQAAEIMGLVTLTPYAKGKLTPIIFKEYNAWHWYNKKEVLKAAKRVKAAREERKRVREESRKHLNNGGTPLVLDAGTDERYEKKLARRIKHIGPTAYILNNPKSLKNWQANIEIMRLYNEEGIITHLLCKTCKKELPYWKFYVECKSGVKRLGRRNNCKQCQSVVRKSHTKSALPRGKRKTFATMFATGISQHIGKKTGVLYDIGTPLVWKKIGVHLGYTNEELIKHIESQFEPWMNWNNHGRPNKVGVPMWQLDHIKAKANFDYDCIEHPDFIECWGLKNLKPIQARLNILKSDKKLRDSLSRSFVNGILRRQGEEYTGGIWAEVPYTIADARKYLESQFTPNMNWKNFGVAWQIDHKIPQAALPYTNTFDPNFTKCWVLQNLQPLPKTQNCSKGSRYNNIKHYYNDL